MTNQLFRTLVKHRIFLREGTQIESLLMQQRDSRPVTAILSVCTGDRTLLNNFKISQEIATNCPTSSFAIQLFHEASSSIVIVFNDTTIEPLLQYAKEQTTKYQQPGFIFIDQFVNFINCDGEKTVIGVNYDGSIESIDRYANWVVPQFSVTGYIDNSNSYKQEMDHRYDD